MELVVEGKTLHRNEVEKRECEKIIDSECRNFTKLIYALGELKFYDNRNLKHNHLVTIICLTN